ncbi:MAG: chemotaxis protein CheW [Candidatus Acidiferrales bacterium]
MMADVQNSGANSYVLLQIGSRRFALPAGIVSELAPPVRLHSFPHTSPLVSGVVVRRGRIIPVYDVALILLGKSSSVHRFYLIARRAFADGSESSAIPVSGECELATAEMQSPGSDRPPYVAGTLTINGESIEVLNFGEVVASAGRNCSETVHAEAQS